MRDKIMKRFAAGTIGVCFTYALIRMPFAAMNDPSELITADWKKPKPTAVVQATEPTTSAPTVSPTELFLQYQAETAIPTEAPTEAVTEAPEEEYIEDNGSDDGVEEWQEEPEQQSGGDVPSLSEFLSLMICGGCRHNCSLVSPRCMKGRSKAESATVEYYEIYGA